jgi:Icc-related predicted phosphoesterase
MGKKFRILSLSDQIVSYIHSSQVLSFFSDIDLIIGCGDLPYYYLEFVLSMLDAPLFFVRGNHDKIVEYSPEGQQRIGPHGGVDLHRNVLCSRGVLLAGVDGCLRYRAGPFQYSQTDMWLHVLSLAPRLIYNRIRYGRYLDFFVTHAPPAGVHDATDLPHQGIKAFRWLIKVFKPAYHFHGHIHVYRPDEKITSIIDSTTVINTYKCRITEFTLPD